MSKGYYIFGFFITAFGAMFFIDRDMHLPFKAELWIPFAIGIIGYIDVKYISKKK